MTECWTAVARSRDLKRKPLRLFLDGEPVVLFRTGDGLAALTDRCPHRHVPLSDGRVRGNAIECPYHGWRFDGRGVCTAIPGHLGETPRYKLRRYAACEHEGAVFLSAGTPAAPPYVHSAGDGPSVRRVVRSDTRSTLIDVAENILDATHTHFTHKGLLRGLSPERHRVTVEVTATTDRVEAVYTGEAKQHGFVSRLLEGGRTKTVARFLYPGIAELEYYGPRGRVLTTTFHLRQATPDRVEGIGWLIGPRDSVLSPLKALFFVPLFRVALQQDRRVLAAARDNAGGGTGDSPGLLGPLDFLRADIEAILSAKRPPAADGPRVHEIEL